MSYTLNAIIKQPIDEAIETLKSALMNHQLGIVSEVNVQATIKNKLGEDVAPYRILGACNPGMAKKLSKLLLKPVHYCPALLLLVKKMVKRYCILWHQSQCLVLKVIPLYKRLPNKLQSILKR